MHSRAYIFVYVAFFAEQTTCKLDVSGARRLVMIRVRLRVRVRVRIGIRIRIRIRAGVRVSCRAGVSFKQQE